MRAQPYFKRRLRTVTETFNPAVAGVRRVFQVRPFAAMGAIPMVKSFPFSFGSVIRKEKELRGKIMKLRTLLLLAVASLSASFLHANTIFSNVSAGIPDAVGVEIEGASYSTSGNYLAVAFQFTPTISATFTGALVDVWALTVEGSDSSVTASLYSSSSQGGVGTLLAQLDTTSAPIFAAPPQLPFTSNETSFTQTSGPSVDLVAGTEYWLALAPGDADSFLHIGSGAASANLLTGEASPTTTFNAYTVTDAEIEIDGTPSSSSTPEPASLALLVSGLFILCAARRFGIRSRDV
jgi:hypothetical protein